MQYVPKRTLNFRLPFASQKHPMLKLPNNLRVQLNIKGVLEKALKTPDQLQDFPLKLPPVYLLDKVRI